MLKKIISSLLITTLLLSVVSPISSALARENSYDYNISFPKPERSDDLSNLIFNRKVDNEKVSIIEVTEDDGTSSLSEWNKETGEVFFDGEYVASLILDENSYVEDSTIIREDPSVLQPFSTVKKYVIGSSDNHLWETIYNKDLQIDVSKTATAIAIAATLAQAFLERKPDQKATALVAAASGVIALGVSKIYNMRYIHTKDPNVGKWSFARMDRLSIYSGSRTPDNLKIQVLYYYSGTYEGSL